VNYRPEYRHEWVSRTYYTQLRLDPLGRESASQMLEYLLGTEPALVSLKQFIIARTEGNPFFMEEIVQALFDEGALVRNGQVKLTKLLDDLRIPLTVQAMLAARIDRLPATEKELLQTLSVISKAPPLELIRRVTGKDVEQLDPSLTNLQLGEFIYEQPSLAGAEYTFKHALTQEVAYNSLLAQHRRLIHEQTAEALEALFGDRLEEHYSELVHHYRRGSNAEKAMHYTLLAAEQAVSRAAYSEATSMVGDVQPLLDQLRSETARLNAEFVLCSIENRIAFILYGGASQQRERAIRRMCLLGESIGGKEQLVGLLALANFYFQRSEPKQGAKLASRCLSLAEATGDGDLLADAHVMAGLLAALGGKFREALSHYENIQRTNRIAGASRSPITRSNPVGLPYEIWSGVAIAYSLHLLGRVGEALKFNEQSLKKARESKHVLSLAFVLAVTGESIRCFRRERELGLAEAEEAIAISEENGFPYWLHRGRLARGWALAELGHLEQGIADMERGIAAFEIGGGGPVQPYATARLAYAYARVGRKEEGLAILNDALEESECAGAQMAQAEILRLKGEVLLMQEGTAPVEAEGFFRAAIDVARAQEAKWWELRTTVSLARVLRDTNRRDEARAILSEIYNWFTEGFDLADLKDAKVLLDKLSE
jgi:tetratricopeptide (TPR) repeat protein